jgi:glycogen synthase
VKRLLFLTPAFPPFPGGGERYARSLALTLRQRGYGVTIVTSDAEREADLWRPSTATGCRETVEDGLRLIRCPVAGFYGGRWGLHAWRKLMVLLSAMPGDQSPRLLRMARLIPPLPALPRILASLSDPPDLVHAFNLSWEYPLSAGWQWARRHGRPLVVTPFAHLGSHSRDRVARNSLMDHQRRVLAEADAVLTLTSIEREGLIQLCRLEPERVRVAGSGLDPLPPAAPLAETLTHFDLQPPLILFIGRVSHDKGAIHAAQAVNALRRRGREATLVLAGQTAPEFDRFYRRLKNEARRAIRPLGVVTEAEKHALLQAATMLLLPSRTDSFGIVILEAWAYGKPVIGANAGGIPGVISDGRDGLLVPFGDVPGLAEAIERLLTDGRLAQTMGQAGQAKIAAHYTWDHVADRVEATYRRLR